MSRPWWRITATSDVWKGSMGEFDHLDYYGILGVNQSVSTTQIKEAYRKISKVTHPDNSDGLANPAWFAAATRARDALINDRRAYDTWLEHDKRNHSSSSSPPPNSGYAPRSNYSSTNGSEHAHLTDDRYIVYLKSRSLLLLFVGLGVLYVDRIHPFATPHDFMRYASLIAWGLFWIVPKKMVAWLMKSRHHTRGSYR
jgi:hypothetical protein